MNKRDREFLRAMRIELDDPSPTPSRTDLIRWLDDQTEATAAAEQTAARWRTRFDFAVCVAAALLFVAVMGWMR